MYSYIQLHPLAYTVKLNIEMSMADLIMKVARSGQAIELNDSHGSRGGAAALRDGPSIVIHTQKDVIVRTTTGEVDEDHYSQSSSTQGRDNDERPLKDATWSGGHHTTAVHATAN